jgi:hypothetical protein
MRAERWTAALLIAVTLGGLAVIFGQGAVEQAVLTSVGEFGRSLSYPEAVLDARERLRGSQLDAETLGEIERELAQRMAARSSACPGALAECVDAQDADVLRYLAFRRIEALLAQPPLAPAAPLGAPAVLSNELPGAVAEIDVASAAGIAVLRGVRGDLVAMTPGGDRIATFARMSGGYEPAVSVSPNGRLAAVATGEPRGVVLLDLEHGETLWELPALVSWMAWLPAASAAIARQGGGAPPLLLDFRLGTQDAHPAAEASTTWGVPLAGGTSRLLGGHGDEIALYTHERLRGELKARRVRTYRVASAVDASASLPVPMRGGNAVIFVSGDDLSMLDLVTGDETVFDIDRRLLARYAKLGEKTVLLDAWQTDADGTRYSPWLLDIDAQTLAQVDGGEQTSPLAGFEGRAGFARLAPAGPWLGDEVASAKAAPMRKVLAGIERRQAERLAPAPIVETESTAPEPGEMAPAQSVVIDNVDAPRIARPFYRESLFADVARFASIQAVGVHSGSRRTSAGEMGSVVRIVVRPGPASVLLVLTSHEKVVWVVKEEPGARVLGVLVGGPEGAMIDVDSGLIHYLGGRDCHQQAYCSNVEQEVKRLTGRGFDGFQGAYEGEEFTVVPGPFHER